MGREGIENVVFLHNSEFIYSRIYSFRPCPPHAEVPRPGTELELQQPPGDSSFWFFLRQP